MRDLVDVDWLGAVRFDIDGRFSRHDEADGLGPVGVHDALAPDDLERELRAIGIRDGDRVVAYDAAGLFSSARAWWMLRAAGIEAAVLDARSPARCCPRPSSPSGSAKRRGSSASSRAAARA